MHQAGRTGKIFERLGRLLSPHYRSLMIDLPGFGESDPLPDGFTVADVAASVIEFLDGLGVEKVRLSGHHTGAVIAGEIAATYPERTVALAPTGYPVYQSPEERRQIANSPQKVRPILTLGGHSVPVITEYSSDGSHILRLFQRAEMMLWYSKVALGATGPMMLPFENLSPEDLNFVNDFFMDGMKAFGSAPTLTAVRGYFPEERLPLVQAPTMFIRSTGPVEAPFCQRLEPLQKLVPGSRGATIENGDIHVIHTKAEELSEILLAFFREVDAGGACSPT
jgi:pimeloyl-ACP methyl ester carboxylesterase